MPDLYPTFHAKKLDAALRCSVHFFWHGSFGSGLQPEFQNTSLSFKLNDSNFAELVA
jgi:hypothetical protein